MDRQKSKNYLAKKSEHNGKKGLTGGSQDTGSREQTSEIEIAYADIFKEKAKKRGRPKPIEERELTNRHLHLLAVFEDYWSEIGYALGKARSLDDVVNAINPLQQIAQGIPYPLNLFFKRAASEKGARLSAIGRDCDDTYKNLQKAVNDAEAQDRLVSETLQALHLAQDPQTKAIVEAELIRRRNKLIRSQMEVEGLTKRHNELNKQHFEMQQLIAQSQLLDFVTSKRYKLTPRNVANAMAGLPEISWQYSFRKTEEITYPDSWAPRENYAVFKAIEFILRRRRDDLPLTKLFHAGLQTLPQTHMFAKDILLKNWADLAVAIKSCSGRNVRSAKLPYRLTSAFLKNRSQQKNALDRVLDDVKNRQAFS